MSFDSLFETPEADAIRVEHNEVLEKILDYVQPVNFMDIAYPKRANWKAEAEQIRKTFGTGEDGTEKAIDDPEVQKRLDDLEKKIDRCILKKPDYEVLIINEVLIVARENGLGICIQNGTVFLFNGQYWKSATPEQVKPFLGSAGEKMGYRKLDCDHNAFRDKLYLQFVSEGTKIKTDFPADVVLINLKNGTYEITPKGGVLREFRESDFLTHQLDFAYDPTAKAPIFMKYLHECLPDAESRNILAEYIGYLFVRNSVMKLEKALLLYGSGANGKSVFFEVLNALLGRVNVSNFSLQSLTNESGYQRAMIAPKLVNYASDISTKLDVAMFKTLVSGEPVEARLPYGKPLVIENYARLIFNLNELPRDIEHTNAFFRRFLIVPFDFTVPEHQQDKELASKIIRDENELAGVFNWIIEGLNRLLIQRNFSPCKASSEVLQKYRNESDSVKMYFDEMNYQKSVSDHVTPLKDAYAEYQQFCKDHGYRPVSIINLRRRLESYGIESMRRSEGQVLFMYPTEGCF